MELLPDFEEVDLALVPVVDLALADVEPEPVEVDLLLLPEEVDCVGRFEPDKPEPDEPEPDLALDPEPDLELDPDDPIPDPELNPELPELLPIPVLLPIDDESEDPDVLPDDMLPDD